MAKTTVLVVEDEIIIAKDIQMSLRKLGYSVPETVPTGEEAVRAAQEYKPDIVLMDIMLKGAMSGIEAAEKIKSLLGIPVIYLTAYSDESTLSKAKITEPYGYIIKPYKEIDLHTTIEMALYKHSKQVELVKERDMYYNLIKDQKPSSDSIFIKSNSRLVKVALKDLVLVEALKDYAIIHTINGKFTVHTTMKELEEKLNGSEFFRVHRSFIVRLDRIVAIEQGNLIVEGIKNAVPVGGSYKDELQERINML